MLFLAEQNQANPIIFLTKHTNSDIQIWFHGTHDASCWLTYGSLLYNKHSYTLFTQ